jgi:hypothetical protein
VHHQCIYCERTFKSLAVAQKLHPVCTMWSCSFLPGLQFTMYPSRSSSRTAAICCYCSDPLTLSTDGKVNGALLKDHMTQHNFRACSQTLYFSGQRFRQHLQDSHRASYDSTLFGGWTLLLKSSRRKTPSLFQQVEVKAVGRQSTTEPPRLTPSKTNDKEKRKQDKDSDKHGDRSKIANIPTNFMELTEIPLRTEPNKLRRKQSGVSTPEQTDGEPRPSLQFFARSATADFTIAKEEPAPASKPKPSKCVVWPSPSGAPTYPAFYRRRLDASTRNRLFMGVEDEALSCDSRHLFRRIQGSVLGGLILHSSLVAAVPALMTNCMDVYPLE